MKKFLYPATILAVVMAACSCNEENKPDEPEEPAVQEFILDSFNGHFMEAISNAYDIYEESGVLPVTVNVEGMKYNKGKYILSGCVLLQKIFDDPQTWQDEDIDVLPAAFGETEYKYNTYDPDIVDLPHLKFLVSALINYAKEKKGLPNFVTFPSDDPAKEGYLPQITMVVSKHDNMMNLRAYMVVIARVINYYVKHDGVLPEEVSSWPATYLDATDGKFAYAYNPANENIVDCPVGDPRVKAEVDAALKGLPATATDRQKAEAIFAYARDEWEWEDYYNTHKGAIGVITSKGGNCSDLSHATIAMCRTAGIPARYLHGRCNFTSGPIGHVIPELFVDGKWWICDPSNNKATFGTPTWKGMETFHGRYVKLEF